MTIKFKWMCFLLKIVNPRDLLMHIFRYEALCKHVANLKIKKSQELFPDLLENSC